MKKHLRILILFSILLSANILLGQNAKLKIIKSETLKEKQINEHRRIKLKTFSGIKEVGKFEVVDATSIKIRGHHFSLSDIQMIKKYPLALSIVTKIVFISGGLVIVVTGLAAVALSAPAGIPVLLFFTGSIVAYLGCELPNLINKGHFVKEKGKFAIELSDLKSNIHNE